MVYSGGSWPPGGCHHTAWRLELMCGVSIMLNVRSRFPIWTGHFKFDDQCLIPYLFHLIIP